MLNARDVIEVNRKAVRKMAKMAAIFRTLFFLNYLVERRLITSMLLLPNRLSFIYGTPLLHDFPVLNTDNPVCKLGNLAVMGNHDKRLMEFLAGNFQ